MRVIKIYMLLFSSIFIFPLSTQEVSTLKSFKFNNPYVFIEKWDQNEGSPKGPAGFYFQSGYIIIGDNFNNNINLYTLPAIALSRSIVSNGPNNKIRPVFYFARGTKWTSITIFDPNSVMEKKLYTIDFSGLQGNEQLDGTPLYLTGNMLFAQVGNKKLASWELLPDGKTFYRDSKQTEIWLNANGQKVGYHLSPYGNIYFGDYSLIEKGLYTEFIWKDLIYPETGLVRNVDEFQTFEFLGIDSKGLNYYIRYVPHPYGNRASLIKNPIRVSICIIDTWTRKVTAFELPANTWNPPRNEEMGLLGTFPWAVSPSGDIFFFDADVQKREYLLKKVQNDWWAELGVDKRRIGRVKDNYIPLQISASTSAKNNGYNYQHEFVWILEESKTTATVNGKAVPWVRVRKIDGREGWMLLSDIYFE